MAFHIADLIEHAVDLVPDRIALETEGQSVTYADVERQANALTHELLELGVEPGDRVGLYSRNTIECVIAMIAIFKARAAMVNVNYRYVEAELEHIVTDSQMAVLIHERQYGDRVVNVLPNCPELAHLVVIDDGTDVPVPDGALRYDDIVATRSGDRDFGPRSDDDIYMLYTGGTTGRPKGVVWRQEDIWRVLGGGINFYTGERIADEWQQARDGAKNGQLVRFPIPPFIHGGSQWAVFQELFAGGKAVIYPEFGGHQAWSIVEKHRVNVVMITGDAMARPMVEALEQGHPEGRPYDTSSMLSLASSAALFSASVKDQYLEMLPNLLIFDAIGSSETGFSGMSAAQKGTSHVGAPRVTADKAAVVLREDGTRVQPGSGEVGILARSGHIPLRYHNDPEKTAKTFKEFGGIRYAIPGDFATVEADGSITMLGRGSQSINTGGEKVFPEEVEAALKAHPDVFDTVVVGVPDERYGQRVAAVIAGRAGARPSLASLNEVARTAIAGYKCPRSIWFVDSIKRSPAGKPDYRWGKSVTESRAADEIQQVISGRA
ncbi:acyl-CoA synthetase [Gordonia sp. NB41Y]|uniref:acyl-CoA synthetase n=1 Tax=Gordonia sp. NB41Y TaxID=875808 RepID=UPI0006B173E7|nr:acyl-CoA synthetase [Gordonia sp. NB41Y]KOY50010.1 acyl-CoA synthetase [Gordonia sp. NB41Y]WLP89241.1 acyl-CoA synthetase [Gordonia sp. NB41Y]